MTLGTTIVVFEGLLLILCFMMGLSFTTATAMAMDAERLNVGTASVIMGALGFLFGSIVSPLVGLGNIMISTGVVWVICSLAASVFAFLSIAKFAKQ